MVEGEFIIILRAFKVLLLMVKTEGRTHSIWKCLAGVVLLSYTKLKFSLLIYIILIRKVPNFEWNKHHFIFMVYKLYAVSIIFFLNIYQFVEDHFFSV